jgi:uncharacterized Zn finger protein (UPF0148 family)
MALYHCERCREHIVGRAGLSVCPWCHSSLTLVVDGTTATEQEDALTRQRVLLERIAAVLYGPQTSEADRAVEARRVLATLAPEFIPPRSHHP